MLAVHLLIGHSGWQRTSDLWMRGFRRSAGSRDSEMVDWRNSRFRFPFNASSNILVLIWWQNAAQLEVIRGQVERDAEHEVTFLCSDLESR